MASVSTPAIATTEFGRTGHHSSRIIFGAAGLWSRDWGQEWASGVLDSATDAGVNHIDTAASYGDSELLLAPWLAASHDGLRNRSRVFLATKTDRRDGDGARAELERSLERLGVDSVDLIQLHNLVEVDEWERAHRPGGALEALVTARDEGLVRFIGVTGHGLRIASMHLRSLEAFDYDSVLLPVNHALMSIPAYADDVAALRKVCSQRRVAVQSIKSIARRRWPSDDVDDVEERRSWYQPLRDADAIARAVRFVLAQPDLFLNTSSDTRLLGVTLDAAGSMLAGGPITAPDPEQLTRDAERYDMTPLFDGAELEVI